MRNGGLDEAQAGIQIAGRKSITSDMQITTPLWQKPKTKLKSLLVKVKVKMKVKEESEKAGLKLNIQKTKIMASDPITSRQRNGDRLYFGGL